MRGMDKLQDVIALLKKYNQEHIIEFMNTLDEQEKDKLENQILQIDFHQLLELYDNTKRKVEIKENKRNEDATDKIIISNLLSIHYLTEFNFLYCGRDNLYKI